MSLRLSCGFCWGSIVSFARKPLLGSTARHHVLNNLVASGFCIGHCRHSSKNSPVRFLQVGPSAGTPAARQVQRQRLPRQNEKTRKPSWRKGRRATAVRVWRSQRRNLQQLNHRLCDFLLMANSNRDPICLPFKIYFWRTVQSLKIATFAHCIVEPLAEESLPTTT